MKPQLAWLLCLLAGLAAALAHPPFGLIGLVLAYGGIMLLAERAPSLKGAFWRGWLAGLGYFALSFYWLAEAFFVDAKTFGWMAPFAVAFMAGGLALFWGAAMTLYRAVKPSGPWRFIVFAGALSALEWLRGHILTGLPWNLPGTSWEAGGWMSQNAHAFGPYGLTWLTLAMASGPWVLLDRQRSRAHWASAALTLAAFGLLSAVGAFQSRMLITLEPGVQFIAVRVIQPDIPQEARYDAVMERAMLDKYLALSTRPPAKGAAFPQLIVWPEGALPASLDSYLAPQSPVRAQIAAALAPGQTLILGGYRYDGDKLRNSLVALERSGQDLAVVGVYDKHHLVPFGEYVPAFARAVGMQQLIPLSPFSPGPPPQPIDIGRLRIQPLICYEALFPGYTARGARLSGKRADLIVNISNDSWFGKTSGPLQHLNQARYRAIEERLPLVRSTPTGVSSVIDKYGRIKSGDRLGLGQSGAIDSQVFIGLRQDVAVVKSVRPIVSLPPMSVWGFVALLTASCLFSISFYAHNRKK